MRCGSRGEAIPHRRSWPCRLCAYKLSCWLMGLPPACLPALPPGAWPVSAAAFDCPLSAAGSPSCRASSAPALWRPSRPLSRAWMCRWCATAAARGAEAARRRMCCPPSCPACQPASSSNRNRNRSLRPRQQAGRQAGVLLQQRWAEGHHKIAWIVPLCIAPHHFVSFDVSIPGPEGPL